MPERVGPYQLFEKLGVGGMGTAYRAEDTRTGAIVALKLLHPHLAEDADAVARMQREARIAGGLDHPNIARVLDSGQEGEHYYIAIEYVDGETLQQRLRTIGRMSEQETQRIALGITKALEAAHAADVIHRDIKPSNILLSKTGDVVVTDFSVARALGYTTVTQVGAFVGTPAYAAPEAVDGKPDIRADLYSLGIVMYQLLTGRVPFAADTPAAALRQQQTRVADMRPLRAAAPSLAPIVIRLMEKDPKRRPQTPAATTAALLAVGDLPTVMMDDATLLKTFVAGSGTTVANRTLSTWRRLPVRARLGGAGAIVTAMAVAGVVAASFLFSGDDPVPPPPETVQVPGGAFDLGSDAGDPGIPSSARPPHRVVVAPFEIDKYEVTNAQYKVFLDDSGGKHQPPFRDEDKFRPYNWRGRDYPESLGDHPVVLVTWDEASAYCAEQGKRLPTEAEWERAARGEDNRAYPWGNNGDPELLNNADTTAGESGVQTKPFGSYPEGASPYGALDMAGNVWEWTDSDAKPYPGGDASITYIGKISRGGSWDNNVRDARSFDRNWDPPDTRYHTVGFRCARSVGASKTPKGTETAVRSETPTSSATPTASPRGTATVVGVTPTPPPSPGPSSDADGDGILDVNDQCITLREDRIGNVTDGCPTVLTSVSPPVSPPTPTPEVDPPPPSPPVERTPEGPSVSPPTSAGTGTFRLLIDCNPGVGGFQSSCSYSLGGGTVTVALVLKNESSASLVLSAFNFAIVDRNASSLMPVASSGSDLDSNPDFNQADVTGSFQCSPPAPSSDTGTGGAGEAVSFISCYNGLDLGPTVAPGQAIVLATLSFAPPLGATAGFIHLVPQDVAIYDQAFTEIGSCGPTISVEMVCGDAGIDLN